MLKYIEVFRQVSKSILEIGASLQYSIDEPGDRNSVNSADLPKAPATCEFSESLN